MKKHILFLLLSIISFNGYSQINFEKGYFIDNSDIKKECLIKNIDWKNNPNDFDYKLNEHGEVLNASIETVKEFEINNASKYIRSSLNIDLSSENLSSLSLDKNPVFNNEVLFLKVLFEGEANLYSYENGNLVRYFYNVKDNEVTQLIHKSYLTETNRIVKNNSFRQQLWNDLKCDAISLESIEKVEYSKKDLIKLFVLYTSCNNSEFVNYENKSKRDLIKLNLRLGINNISFEVVSQNPYSIYNVDFGNKINLRFGIESEFILGFNNNKWSLILEPTYQYFKSEEKNDTKNVVIDYKSIELPLGLRYYFFINNNSKIFINTSYIFDFNLNSKINYGVSNDLEITKSTNLGFGIGFKQSDKYSIELRYQTSRELLSTYQLLTSKYNTTSLIFGYTIF